jgi:hypothetical protein
MRDKGSQGTEKFHALYPTAERSSLSAACDITWLFILLTNLSVLIVAAGSGVDFVEETKSAPPSSGKEVTPAPWLSTPLARWHREGRQRADPLLMTAS